MCLINFLNFNCQTSNGKLYIPCGVMNDFDIIINSNELKIIRRTELIDKKHFSVVTIDELKKYGVEYAYIFIIRDFINKEKSTHKVVDFLYNNNIECKKGDIKIPHTLLSEFIELMFNCKSIKNIDILEYALIFKDFTVLTLSNLEKDGNINEAAFDELLSYYVY